MNDDMDEARFKIRMDDDDFEEHPEPVQAELRHEPPEDLNDLKYARLSRRFIRIAVLISVVFSLALVFMHFDLRNRYDRTRQTDITAIMGISRNLDDRLNSVNAQADGLKTEYQQRIAEIDRMMDDVKKKLRNADASIDKMRTTQATTEDVKKAVGQIEARLDKDLAAIRKESGAAAASVSALKEDVEKIREEMYPLAETVKHLRLEILKIQKEMPALRAEAEAARKIDSLRAAHEALKRQVEDLSRKTIPPAAPPSGGTPAGKPSGTVIQEQDIRE